MTDTTLTTRARFENNQIEKQSNIQILKQGARAARKAVGGVMPSIWLPRQRKTANSAVRALKRILEAYDFLNRRAVSYFPHIAGERVL